MAITLRHPKDTLIKIQVNIEDWQYKIALSEFDETPKFVYYNKGVTHDVKDVVDLIKNLKKAQKSGFNLVEDGCDGLSLCRYETESEILERKEKFCTNRDKYLSIIEEGKELLEWHYKQKYFIK